MELNLCKAETVPLWNKAVGILFFNTNPIHLMLLKALQRTSQVVWLTGNP